MKSIPMIDVMDRLWPRAMLQQVGHYRYHWRMRTSVVSIHHCLLDSR
jgi:hypothetical protein